MSQLPASPCYLNGNIVPLRDAHVSVLDRGFIFGDGVYEVVPLYGGIPFRFAEHMARLDRSLAELRISNPHTQAEWWAIAEQLVAGAPTGSSDHLLYLQVTRGVALRDHAMPAGLTPTVFCMVSPMLPASPAARTHGVACVSADDFRWQKAHIKSTSLLGAVLARQISADVGAAETILFRNGYLSEASSSNVWMVKDGTVTGTPADNLVLEGIRYGLIEALCAELGIPFELRRVSREEIFVADEILLSSATKEVLAVTALDSAAVGSGHPGPVYDRLYAAYQRAKSQARRPETTIADGPVPAQSVEMPLP